jgi:hypothetical protein
MIVFRKASRFRFAPRTFDFRLEIFFWFSFKKQIKGKVSVLSFLAKASLVMVLQLFKVKLTDGFAEFDCPFQYFTKAILLGAVQRNSPLSML